MDIYLFKKDLDTFSKSDIQLLAKMYELTGDLNDLRWQIALRHYQSRKQMITGDLNIDKQILLEMDPRTFARTCRTDKTMHGLCKEIEQERIANVKAELRKHRNTFNKLIKRFDFDYYRDVEDLDLMNLDLIPNHVNMIMEQITGDVSNNQKDIMEKVALLLAQLPETTPQDLARLFERFYTAHRDAFVGNPNVDLNLIDAYDIYFDFVNIIQDFSLKDLNQHQIDELLSKFAGSGDLKSFIEFLEDISDNVQIKNEYVRSFLEDIINNFLSTQEGAPKEEYMPKVRKIIALMLQKDPSIQWKNFVDEIKEINDDKITKMVYMPNIKGLRMFSK